jgi:hypothetical protein
VFYLELRMSKNVIYILVGLGVVALIGLYLQSIVVKSLRPPDDSIVVPDTHQKILHPIKGNRPNVR